MAAQETKSVVRYSVIRITKGKDAARAASFGSCSQPGSVSASAAAAAAAFRVPVAAEAAAAVVEAATVVENTGPTVDQAGGVSETLPPEPSYFKLTPVPALRSAADAGSAPVSEVAALPASLEMKRLPIQACTFLSHCLH